MMARGRVLRLRKGARVARSVEMRMQRRPCACPTRVVVCATGRVQAWSVAARAEGGRMERRRVRSTTRLDPAGEETLEVGPARIAHAG